jgi:hypothetical protein
MEINSYDSIKRDLASSGIFEGIGSFVAATAPVIIGGVLGAIFACFLLILLCLLIGIRSLTAVGRYKRHLRVYQRRIKATQEHLDAHLSKASALSEADKADALEAASPLRERLEKLTDDLNVVEFFLADHTKKKLNKLKRKKERLLRARLYKCDEESITRRLQPLNAQITSHEERISCLLSGQHEGYGGHFYLEGLGLEEGDYCLEGRSARFHYLATSLLRLIKATPVVVGSGFCLGVLAALFALLFL